MCSPSIFADNKKHKTVLTVTGSEALSQERPDTLKKILDALGKTNFEIQFRLHPNKRSLVLVKKGRIALDVARTPLVYANDKQVVRLEPSLFKLEFNKVTSSKTPENCDAPQSLFSTMSVAVILGVEAYNHYYQQFNEYVELMNPADVLKFVARQRADLTFMPEFVVKNLQPEERKMLHVCSGYMKTFHFYSFLHEDYLWAKEKIEQVYKEAF